MVCAGLQALLQLCRNKFICRKLRLIQIITVYRHTNRFCLQEVSTDLFSHWRRGQFCIYEENSFCLLDELECYSLSHIQLCDPMDSGGGARQTPLSPGILQARILEWVAIPFSRDLSSPGTESGSPALQADSSLSEPPEKLLDGLMHLSLALPLTSCNIFCAPSEISKLNSWHVHYIAESHDFTFCWRKKKKPV